MVDLRVLKEARCVRGHEERLGAPSSLEFLFLLVFAGCRRFCRLGSGAVLFCCSFHV